MGLLTVQHLIDGIWCYVKEDAPRWRLYSSELLVIIFCTEVNDLRKDINRWQEVGRQIRLPDAIHVTVVQVTIPQLAEGLHVVPLCHKICNEEITVQKWHSLKLLIGWIDRSNIQCRWSGHV